MRKPAILLMSGICLFSFGMIQAQNLPSYVDGKYCKSYTLFWADTISNGHIGQAFSQATFDKYGWNIQKLDGKYGKFANAPDGKPSIEVVYPHDPDMKHGVGINCETVHFRSKSESYDTVVFRYDLFFELDPGDYSTASHISGKIMGFTSNDYGNGHDLSRQTGFQVRDVWRARSSPGLRIGQYDFHLNRAPEGTQPPVYGAGIGPNITVQPKKWISVVREVILNDPGVENGITRHWINGVLSGDKTNLLYRKTGSSYYWEGLRFNTFTNDVVQYRPQVTFRIWFRNFQIWIPGTSNGTPEPDPDPLTQGRIICGHGQNFEDANGNTWFADAYFTGGTSFDRTTAVDFTNTEDDRIYQTERYGDFSYAIPVENGDYTVRLHFGEGNPSISSSGMRVFNVDVEGEMISDLDVFEAAGGLYLAHVEEVTVTVSDHYLNIEFLRIDGKNAPMIHGIEFAPAQATARRPESAASVKTGIAMSLNRNVLSVSGNAQGTGDVVVSGFTLLGRELFSSPVPVSGDGTFSWSGDAGNTSAPFFLRVEQGGRVLAARMMMGDIR